LLIEENGEEGAQEGSELYEVYDKYEKGIPEDCAVFRESKFLKKLDSYGYEKLRSENYLKSVFANMVALRLPDVVGPFDCTLRLMKYVLWFSGPCKAPIGYEDKDFVKKVSFVHSDDVVKTIVKLFQNPLWTGFRVWNIACREQVHLDWLLRKIKECTKSNKEITHFKGNYICHNFLPSVECGPIDI
jgi:nucleoside-diphosphate-sugar epimerase